MAATKEVFFKPGKLSAQDKASLTLSLIHI